MTIAQDPDHETSIGRVRPLRGRTRGTAMGPVMRLVSPTDLGELLKPFVFIDLADIPPQPGGGFRWHPHSGIATLTIVHDGQNEYRETTGVHGGLRPGGIEYMASGRGVWHTARPVGRRNLKGYQLWLLLPPGEDMAPPISTYLDAGQVPQSDGVRVILGAWNGLASPLKAPPETTLLDVSLVAGRRWSFAPPAGQELAWLVIHAGSLTVAGTRADAGELLVFEDGSGAVDVVADADAGFIIGSAHRSPSPLHTGSHSVHTSAAALRAGEAEIARLAHDLRQGGIIG